MMERYNHINPWADKLQNIHLPEESASWKAMEAALDKEMPVRKWNDRRRWLLLIILLLLLIGVCNCPGRHRMKEREAALKVKSGIGGDTEIGWTKDNDKPGMPKLKGGIPDKHVIAMDTMAERKTLTNILSPQKVTSDVATVERRDPRLKKSARIRHDQLVYQEPAGAEKDTLLRKVNGRMAHRLKSIGSTSKDHTITDPTSDEVKTPAAFVGGRKSHVASRNTNTSRVKRGVQIKQSHVINAGPDESSDSEGSEEGVKGAQKQVIRVNSRGGSGKTDDSDSSTKPVTKASAGIRSRSGSTANSKKSVGRTDSTKVAVKKHTTDSTAHEKGWVVGIGLNQFFTVGEQQKSNYNSTGTSGGISDYIPIPMVRYYFNRKLYVQLEAQFNTPQYTSKNLLASQSKPDTLSVPGRSLQSSLYIKKLFYFNMPLSIHYSPAPNLYIGTGIQYARLTNGVALYQDNSRDILGGPDTLLTSKIKSFKDDTTYSKLKTTEFRLLLDLNYNFKRWVVGARYNRALTDFINLQVSANQVTQSRNSSFQIYLRYFIWDGRKKN